MRYLSCLLVLAAALALPALASPTTTRVSLSYDGSQGNGGSHFDGSALSGGGRYVAFYSDASNLVANDTNAKGDIFVRDTLMGTTRLVSVASDGSPANGSSYGPVSISADGRYVVFQSMASNLVANDTNGREDVFVRDTHTYITRRVSVASDGSQGNGDSLSSPSAISFDGRYVVFLSSATNLVAGDTNGKTDVFVRDMVAGTTIRVSVSSTGQEANHWSGGCSISLDGRCVAFQSLAYNLVPGDTNGVDDIFVRDIMAGTTQRVSVSTDGSQATLNSSSPFISANGRYVAFASYAANLVPGDTNGVMDVFVRDTKEGATRRVSVDSDGSQGNGISDTLSLSADGRYVAFGSAASNLVLEDSNGMQDVFLRDVLAGTTQRVSVSSDGSQGNSDCGNRAVAIGPDGRFVAFSSGDAHLVAGDTNNRSDVFIHGPLFDAQPFGDVNGDYLFNIADVHLLMRIIGGMYYGNPTRVQHGDAAPGGGLDLRDAVMLLRTLLAQ